MQTDHTALIEARWPIPLAKDHEGLFCDAPDEAAAAGLLMLMTGISEDSWCASWLHGLEYSLWDAANGGNRNFGMNELTERQCLLLLNLAEEADGWWHWVEGPDGGARFCSLDNWKAHIAAIRAKGAQS